MPEGAGPHGDRGRGRGCVDMRSAQFMRSRSRSGE